MFFIYFFLLLSFRLVRSVYEIDDKFTNLDFYESFSSPKECFNIYHNNPIGPAFLLIDIEYEFYSNKSQIPLKHTIKKYVLKRTNIPCNNSIKFPTISDYYNKMYLIFQLFLYYNENPVAISIYNFYKCFDPVPLIIVTTKNNFGLMVEFFDFSNHISHIVNPSTLEIKHYLLSLRKNKGPICVITDNNKKLILLPRKQSLRDNHLITSIKIKYFQNKDAIFKEYYPAFECYLNNNDFVEYVYLIHTMSQSNIYLSLIYSDLNKNKKTSLLTMFWNLIRSIPENMNILPFNAQILFIVQPNRKIHLYRNNFTTIELISDFNITYYKMSQKIVDISNGVKRCKWICY